MEIGAPGILAQAPERQHSVEEVASLWTVDCQRCVLARKKRMPLMVWEEAGGGRSPCLAHSAASRGWDVTMPHVGQVALSTSPSSAAGDSGAPPIEEQAQGLPSSPAPSQQEYGYHEVLHDSHVTCLLGVRLALAVGVLTRPGPSARVRSTHASGLVLVYSLGDEMYKWARVSSLLMPFTEEPSELPGPS